MIKIDLKQRKREVLGVIAILFVIVTGMSIYKYASFSSGFEITEETSFLLLSCLWLLPMPRSSNRPILFISVIRNRASPSG